MDTPIKKRNSNGTFLTGNNEGAGRPKGTPNKTTATLRNSITYFLNDKLSELDTIWNSLDDREKATLFIHLMKVVMPKAQSDTSNDIQKHDFSNLTTEEIKQLLNE